MSIEQPKDLVASQPDISSERKFLESLASIPAEALPTQLDDLCRAWCRCMQCDWVWLWQFNQSSARWELFGQAREGVSPPAINDLRLQDLLTVTEYVSRRGQPEFVTEPKLWGKELDGRTYRVSTADFLARHKCASFVSIPLLPPHSGPLPDGRLAHQVLCCHYLEPSAMTSHSPVLLLLKGRLTYFFITSAYEFQQRRLLTELNKLASPYVSAQNRDPRKNRQNYSIALIQLISRELGIPYVSIFLTDQSGTTLECVATTMLYDRNGKQYSNDELDGVHYTQGNSRTWRCFASGQPQIIHLGDSPVQDGTFQEVPFSSLPSNIPWLLYPIPSANDEVVSETNKPIGVIRCTGRPVGHGSDQHRNYLPSELQLLSHIAVQSGLVLQALSSNVHREMQVAGVKHDLIAPMLMARDAAAAALTPLEELRRFVRRSGPIYDPVDSLLQTLTYQVKDINAAAFRTLQLLYELDSDPLERIKPHFEATFLAGDIIAGMKATLLHYARETRRMSIEFGDFSSVPPLMIDRFQIWRALGNLIVNAVKYGEPGTKISVNGLRIRERRAVAIAVMNYGIGVNPEDKERVFQGNFRSIEAQRIATGEGWGLKIAQRIMRLHKGDLELTQLKDPTVFTLVFPSSAIVDQ